MYIYICVHWTWHVKSCLYIWYIYIYDTYIICISIQTHGFFLQLQFFKAKKRLRKFPKKSNPTHRGFRSRGWAIYEVEFFTNSDCQTGRLEGEVIASGYAPPLADHGPINALDQTLGGGNVWKGLRWRVKMFFLWWERHTQTADGSMCFFVSKFWKISINGKKNAYICQRFIPDLATPHICLSHISKDQPTQWGSRLSYPPRP